MSKKKKAKKKQKQQQAEFEKYRNFYGNGQLQGDLDRKVFNELHKKGLDNTNIEKLLEITIDENRAHEEIKQSIENRVGLLIAMWGVLVSALISADVPLSNLNTILNESEFIGLRIIVTFALVGQLLFAILSLVCAYKTLKTQVYKMTSLKYAEHHFEAAVEDEYASIVKLLGTYTYNWNENINAIITKSKYYEKLVLYTVSFGLFTLLGYLFTR